MTSALSITPAEYRKGHVVIRAVSDGSGFKTSLHHAIERYGGRWVHRSRGYVFPARKGERVFRLLQRFERWEIRRKLIKSL